MRAAATFALALALLPVAAGASLGALPQAVAAGSGRLSVWGFAVYDAKLWVAPGFTRSTFQSHEFALELTYLREFRSSDIARRSLEEMARAAPVEPAQAARWQEQLSRLLPDVVQGDRLIGRHRPGQGAEFFHNGRRVGELADAEFARRFFAIWLGPRTSEPALREALLAGTPP